MLQSGWTALMCAAGKGHIATVAELVRLGAEINAKNKVRACERVELESTHSCRVLQDGWTALVHAAGNGHTATVAELVRLGADIHAKDKVRVRGGCPA